MVKIHVDMHQDKIDVVIGNDSTPEDIAFELASAVNVLIHEYNEESKDDAAKFYGTLLHLILDDEAFIQRTEKLLDSKGQLS